jgi:hypothetical protein
MSSFGGCGMVVSNMDIGKLAGQHVTTDGKVRWQWAGAVVQVPNLCSACNLNARNDYCAAQGGGREGAHWRDGRRTRT